MTTSFYSFVVLIKMMQTTIIESEAVIMNGSHNDMVQQLTTERKNFDEHYKQLQSIAHNNDKQEKLYTNIRKAFCQEFYLQDVNDKHIQLNIKISKNYSNESVKNFCDNKKLKFMEEVGWEDADLDLAFVCAYNTFVEISTFTMNTFNEVKKMRQVHTNEIEFREKLIEKKAELCRDYIISVNWAYKFYYNESGFSLLLNFTSIEVNKSDEDTVVMKVNYEYNRIDDRYKLDQKTMDDMLKSIMTDYNNKTDIIEKQQVLENKKTEIMKDLLKSLSIGIKDNYEKNVKVVFNAIAMLQGSTIKIENVAQSGYFKNDTIHKSIAYDTNKQKKFIENHKNNQFYAKESLMKIDILRIHTPQSIVYICILSMLQQNHISKLTKFTDRYVKTLLNCIKEKLKMEITNYFDQLINKIYNELSKTYIKAAKAIFIDHINNIEGYEKITQGMNTTQKLERYCDYISVENYENAYRIVFDAMKDIKYNAKYSADNAPKIIKTKEILKSHSGEDNFFKKIIDIIKLYEKIQDDMENVIVDH
ncbi:hypothetical protein BDAP_001537 [Binucleata daphniae]